MTEYRDLPTGAVIERAVMLIIAAKKDKDLVRYYLLDAMNAAYEGGLRDGANPVSSQSSKETE